MEISATNTDKYKIIKLAGKITWEDAQDLDKQIRQFVEEEGFSHLVFNMDDVSFICSGGIGALVFNLNKVKEKNGGIYIVSSNEYFNYICETLKFDIIFNGYLFKTYEEFCDSVLDKKAG